MTRKSPAIDQKSPTGYVEIHPDDAGKSGIANGDKVQVATVRGKVTTIARVTPNIEAGCIFMPFHFAEGPANMLTNDALDPVAKIPEFKVCAAKMSKI
jgi:anaerobic selenocysteine-containing dehydrogenase